MPTNLAIDPELLQKALEVSGLKTKKDTVNLALKELINRHKQLEIIAGQLLYYYTILSSLVKQKCRYLTN